MPAQARHIQAAANNEDLARSLLSDSLSPSWAVVLAFYAALHWIDAFLATSGIHPRSHDERGRYVLRVQQLRAVHIQYRTLESRSRDARYELRAFSQTEAEYLIQGQFAEIKAHVKSLLNL